MSQYDNDRNSNAGKTTVNVDIDVTKIVKYSCITSAIIVFIIFASGVIKKYFDR